METSTLISLAAVVISFIFSFTGYKRSKTTDDKSDASEMTTVIVKLENIDSGVKEIKAEMRDIKQDVKAQNEKIIRIDESLKSAWKCINKIEGTQNETD